MNNQTKQAFKQIFDHLKNELQPTFIEETQLNLGSSALILGTGPEESLTSIINKIKNISQNTSIHIIVKPFLEAPMKTACGNKDFVYTYESNDSFELDKVHSILKKNRLTHFDSTIIAFNNTWGMGYENVLEIVKSLKPKQAFAYNVENRWIQLTLSRLKNRIATLKLCTAMANWHWEEGYSSIDE
ncbi:MAG TPA: hypothetical protein DIU37_06245 [Opitutae bacterium]|nr:hypothetical protein [Opitutae bacterium]